MIPHTTRVKWFSRWKEQISTQSQVVKFATKQASLNFNAEMSDTIESMTQLTLCHNQY